jgi:hypothetical protein
LQGTSQLAASAAIRSPSPEPRLGSSVANIALSRIITRMPMVLWKAAGAVQVRAPTVFTQFEHNILLE